MFDFSHGKLGLKSSQVRIQTGDEAPLTVATRLCLDYSSLRNPAYYKVITHMARSGEVLILHTYDLNVT